MCHGFKVDHPQKGLEQMGDPPPMRLPQLLYNPQSSYAYLFVSKITLVQLLLQATTIYSITGTQKQEEDRTQANYKDVQMVAVFQFLKLKI